MARDDLNLKIRALVEGVQEVQQLTNEVDALQKEAGQTVPDSTQKFRRGLNKTQKEARDTSDVMGDLRGTIGAMAGVLGAGAIGGKLLQTANEMENARRQADALGTSVQNFSELDFTFRQFKLGQDDVSDALSTLSDRAKDAQQGTESFVEDFRLLNIEVEDLRGKRPDELFRLVAERVAQIEDPADRVAGVVRTFGDDLGRRLLPLLKQGSEGLERHAERAREVGAAYDEDAAAGAAEAARSMREVREIFDAQFNELVADNADAMTSVAGALGSIVNLGGDVLTFFTELSKGLAITIAQAQGYEATLTGQIQQTESELDSLQNRRERQLENIQRLQDEGTTGPVLDELRKGLAETDKEIAAVQNRLRGFREMGEMALSGNGSDDDGAGAGTGDSGDTSGGGGGSDDDVDVRDRVDPASLGAGTGSSPAAATGGMATLDADFQQMLREGKQLFEETRRASERYNATIAEYDRLLEAGAISQETYNRAVAQAKEQLESAGDQAEETGKEISEFAKQASRNIQNQLGDTLRDTLMGNFDDIEDDWRDLIFNMATEAASAQLNEWLFGTDGGFSGGAVGSFFDALGSMGSSSGGGSSGGYGQQAGQGGGSDYSWLTTLVSAVGSFFHEGGVVGQGGRPGLVPAGTWANAPRMHSGGVAGLRRDEVPIIAKKGEEVLTEDNPRHRSNAGAAPQVNVRNINVRSDEDIADAMSRAPGEEVILNVISRHPEIIGSNN